MLQESIPYSTVRPDEASDFFDQLKNRLNAKHTQRDNINKICRDITSDSKKLIFTIHRAPKLFGTFPVEEFESITSLLESLSSGFYTLFRYTKCVETLHGIETSPAVLQAREDREENADNQIEARTTLLLCILEEVFHRSLKDNQHICLNSSSTRTVSNAVQEFIEAVTFLYYFSTKAILSLEATRFTVSVLVLSRYLTENPITGLEDLGSNLFRAAVLLLCGLNKSSLEGTAQAGITESSDIFSYLSALSHAQRKNGSNCGLSRPGFCFIREADYILGLLDLTGELMRCVVSRISETRHDSDEAGYSDIVYVYKSMEELSSGILRLLDLRPSENITASSGERKRKMRRPNNFEKQLMQTTSVNGSMSPYQPISAGCLPSVSTNELSKKIDVMRNSLHTVSQSLIQHYIQSKEKIKVPKNTAIPETTSVSLST